MARLYVCSSRIVYLTKTTVVKQETKDTKGENKREWIFWSSVLERQDKPFFAPILSYNNARIVQKRIYFRRGRVPVWAFEKTKELAQKYKLSDIGVDYLWNWGMSIDNIPVIYDYGM